MVNETRIYNGKKQVKKGKIWRPCCSFEGCTNRTEKPLCSLHNEKTGYKRKGRIKQTPLTRKIAYERDPWKTEIQEYLVKNTDFELLKIIAMEDKKKYNISDLSYLKRDDVCEFKCKCNIIDIRDIRSIIELNRGMLCKECILLESLKKQNKQRWTEKSVYIYFAMEFSKYVFN